MAESSYVYRMQKKRDGLHLMCENCEEVGQICQLLTKPRAQNKPKPRNTASYIHELCEHGTQETSIIICCIIYYISVQRYSAQKSIQTRRSNRSIDDDDRISGRRSSACQNGDVPIQPIFTKFGDKVAHGPRNKPLVNPITLRHG